MRMVLDDDEEDSSTYLCTVESPYVDNDLDCDDQESEVNPSMDEICDGIDNNQMKMSEMVQ